ncbi:hypothetical protein C0993_009435 [Termitomyces sp. T159_Od127]|nr:hypothetical protein C0993_009435 [Termitomyces sp. T159_Od127]
MFSRSNCLERGFANTCLIQSRGLPTTDASKHPVTRCIPCVKTFVAGFFTVLVRPFNYVYNHPKTVASVALGCADECKEEYDEWIAVFSTRVVNLDVALSGLSSAPTNGTDNIGLQVLSNVVSPPNPSQRECAIPESHSLPPLYSTSQSPSSPLARPPPPEKVIKLKEAWCRYLDSRVTEWKIAGTTACVFVA